MRVLHTSDWHLGRSFYGSRHSEVFAAFLDWLGNLIEDRKVDVLLVAGDVFDTVTPGNLSQSLYYRFLNRMSHSCCRHIIITAGNHDSPTFLEAPRALLRLLRIHVVGTPGLSPDDEVVVLQGADGSIEGVVCAVPFLRDRDIRSVAADESVDDKNARLLDGIRKHYQTVCDQAEEQRKHHPDIPLIAMGHLFAAGGRVGGDEGVRDLYIGSLAHVPLDLFPRSIDYLALGHLHSAQAVGGNPVCRYSGSHLPMGFGDANQSKKVLQIEFNGREPLIEELAVPCFQALRRISGDREAILIQIERLREQMSDAWLEIDYTGSVLQDSIREVITDAVAGSDLEVKRIRNRQAADQVLAAQQEEESLAALDVLTVFQRCLEQNDVPQGEWAELEHAFQEILHDLRFADRRAED